MTETPTQSEEQPRSGLATENLRSYERLRRSVTDRKVAGVAGGLGRHLNIDPTILRVLFVVLVFFGGAGLLIYAAAWLLVPEEGTEHSLVQTSPSTRNALLIAAGVLAALLLVGDAAGGIGFPWPLALVALVVAVVLLNRDSAGSPPPPAGPSHPVSPPADAATPAGPTDPSQETPMSDNESPTTLLETTPPAPPVGPWSYASGAAYTPPPAPPAPDRGPKLFGPTVALLLVALGALGLIDSAGADVPSAAYAALALTVVGVMLLVGSVVGRAGGLIFLGVVATLALAVTASVDGTGWSSDTRLSPAPSTADAVADRYDITAGQIRLDLTSVEDLENLDGRRLDLQATAGELLVIVPDGVDVDVDAGISLGGEIEVDGYIQNGNGVDVSRSIDGGDDVPQIDLELDLVVGHIEVRQEEAA